MGVPKTDSRYEMLCNFKVGKKSLLNPQAKKILDGIIKGGNIVVGLNIEITIKSKK